MTHPTDDHLRKALAFYTDDANWRQNGPLDPNSANFTGGPARTALARPSQAGDRQRVQVMRDANWRPAVDYWRERAEKAEAALAAAPQPATAPADERAAMIEVIRGAMLKHARAAMNAPPGTPVVQNPDEVAADALLAAGYRKADALLAERDALIHDIERAKESESALLAELEEARVRGAE